MPRVLLIDDEPLQHELVARALAPLQCEMHYSENGRDGLAKAHQLKPDLIITDVMMPDINGYEVTRLLRRELAVFCHAHPGDDDPVRFAG